MSKIYKITNTKITTSKNGYTIFNLELDQKTWASMLAPICKYDKRFNKLYNIYEAEQSLDSLIGKFMTISLKEDKYSIKINTIEHFDSLFSFKELLDKSNNIAFTTNIPMYDFLKSQKYPINTDGSITLKNPYNFFNIIKKESLTICYPNNPKPDDLTFENIKKIYDYFYKDVPLAPYNTIERGANSYFSLTSIAIIRMDNHVRVSNKMTTSGDYDYWAEHTMLKIGDKLPEEYIEYLNKGYISQEKMHKHRTMLQNFQSIIPEDINTERYLSLRSLRSKIAVENGVPFYVIFGDKILKELAIKHPKSREAMLSVNGVGEKKFEQFGEVFLKLMREW